MCSRCYKIITKAWAVTVIALATLIEGVEIRTIITKDQGQEVKDKPKVRQEHAQHLV